MGVVSLGATIFGGAPGMVGAEAANSAICDSRRTVSHVTSGTIETCEVDWLIRRDTNFDQCAEVVKMLGKLMSKSMHPFTETNDILAEGGTVKCPPNHQSWCGLIATKTIVNGTCTSEGAIGMISRKHHRGGMEIPPGAKSLPDLSPQTKKLVESAVRAYKAGGFNYASDVANSTVQQMLQGFDANFGANYEEPFTVPDFNATWVTAPDADVDGKQSFSSHTAKPFSYTYAVPTAKTMAARR
ncbi:hypothetical protein KEM54_005504 [Ascosphaera aggregata]|nr:hypothetical protein KEM54_005504 [Ascosphaera aggregata]